MKNRDVRMLTQVLVAGILCVLLVGSLPTSAAAESRPGWSKGGSGWSGSGTVFLPGGTHVGSRDGSSNCPGCSWQIIPVCEIEGPEACAILHDCPVGRPFVLVVVTSPGGGSNFAGGQCLNGDPVSAEDLGRMVSQRVRQAAPVARPGFQPQAAALTALPTNFRSGQPRSISRSETIAGIPVEFRATARWRWAWGDGRAPLVTDEPGGSWPNLSVTHVFRRPGTKKVRLQTLWTAEYTVNGVGPFSVDGGPVEQSTVIPVPVREARSVLIGAQIS